MHATLPTPGRTLTRCLVCGSREVRSDEVVDRGFVLLHECPHCDHRWTAPVEPRAAAPLAVRRLREVPTAA
jgi:hypothetical protein